MNLARVEPGGLLSGARVDVAVIGAGPAGLAASLNLARARRSLLVLDSNRPRNAATFASHGFITRDGVSPLELRRLGRVELEDYPEVTFRKPLVNRIEADGDGFLLSGSNGTARAKAVVIATGLVETLPPLASVRAYYGTSIHSCVACDGYEYADAPIALIGETDDLAARAEVLSEVSRDLIVFTNAVGTVTQAEEDRLSARRVRVDRRPIDDVVGDKDSVTGVRLADGEVIARSAVFVRPLWSTALGYTEPLGLALDAEGYIVVDGDGRSSVAGVYAAGDSTPPGPQQLMVAAGAGTRVAATVHADLTARYW